MIYKMKNVALALMAVVSVSGASHAATGTVNFTGQITANTCTFNNGTSDMNVQMGTVSASDLASAGKTTGDKPFSLSFTNCSSGVNSLAVRFSGDNNTDGTLKLTNDSGVAKNVALGIYDKNNALVKVGDDSADYSVSGGSVIIPLTAKYIATASGVTAGSANSTAVFTALYK